MACRTVHRAFLVTQPEPPPFMSRTRSIYMPFSSTHRKTATHTPNCGCKLTVNARTRQFARNCFGNGKQGPPQEAVLKAICEVSKKEGRVRQTTNVVIGGTIADDSTNEWHALDKKAMIYAVESVIQRPIPEGWMKQKKSSRGRYVSVNIGPVRVASSEQVQAVYNAMRRDEKMKYFL